MPRQKISYSEQLLRQRFKHLKAEFLKNSDRPLDQCLSLCIYWFNLQHLNNRIQVLRIDNGIRFRFSEHYNMWSPSYIGRDYTTESFIYLEFKHLQKFLPLVSSSPLDQAKHISRMEDPWVNQSNFNFISNLFFNFKSLLR